MPTAKIVRYQLAFENELSSATDTTATKLVRVSAGDAVEHRIRGYYERPVSSANITVEFDCAHPSSGPAKYLNGGGPPIRRWKDELEVDWFIRRDSAAIRLRELVVTAPSAPMGAGIECTFKVKKRWSKELSDWVAINPDHSNTCVLRYRVEP